MSIAGSILYGLANLLHPRMLWLMIWPMLVALAVWGTVAVFLWARIALWLAGVLSGWIDSASFLASLDLGSATLIAANVLLFLLFVPLVYLTALFILGLFGMQAMVDHVARRSFAQLERRRGGGVAGSGWNGIVALVGMLLGGLVTLPLWLIPPLWPVIPVVILGWGNQRLLRYDALAEHADREEMRRLFRRQRGSLYLLGVLMALIAYIPLLGFLAPVWFGLAFIHYLLGALERERTAIGRLYAGHPNKELAAGNAPP
jgi:CysZ protein